jgi:hypothetical protein
MFAMLLYNKKGTASPCFMEKAVPYKKKSTRQNIRCFHRLAPLVVEISGIEPLTS